MGNTKLTFILYSISIEYDCDVLYYSFREDLNLLRLLSILQETVNSYFHHSDWKLFLIQIIVVAVFPSNNIYILKSKHSYKTKYISPLILHFKSNFTLEMISLCTPDNMTSIERKSVFFNFFCSIGLDIFFGSPLTGKLGYSKTNSHSSVAFASVASLVAS